MSDDGNKKGAPDDKTVPMPVFDPNKAVDDDKTVNRPPAGHEGSAVRVRIPSASFDDDVAQRKVPARPARTLTPAAAPAPKKAAPRPVDASPSSVFSDGGPAPPASRPDRSGTKKVEPILVSEADRAEPDEPTVARLPDLPPTAATQAADISLFEGFSDLDRARVDPVSELGKAEDFTQEAAPPMKPEEIESIPTAPIPMLTGMHENLRNDEPSFPKERPDAAPTTQPDGAAVPDVTAIASDAAPAAPQALADVTAPIAPLAQAPTAQARDAPVDRTAPFMPPTSRALVAGAAESAALPPPTSRNRIAEDPTVLKAPPPAPKKKTSPLLIALFAGLGTVAVGALVVIVVAASGYRVDHTPPPTAPTTKPSVTTTQPGGTATEGPTATPDATPPPNETPPTGTPPTATPDATPPTATPDATPPTATPDATPPTATPDATPPTATPDATPPTATPDATPPTAMPDATEATPAQHAPAIVHAPRTRPADGFGPFYDHSGYGAASALAKGARGCLGSNPFGDSTVGLRGDVRRAVVHHKDKKLDVTLECSFIVYDETGGRATLGATAHVVDDDSKGRRAVVTDAATRCAKSLDADLRTAVERARR